MNIGEYQVLGIRKAVAKNGRNTATLFLTTPFEEWEVAGSESCEGFKTSAEFMYDPEKILPIDLKVNDVVTLSYRKGFSNTAVLSGVQIVKKAGK